MRATRLVCGNPTSFSFNFSSVYEFQLILCANMYMCPSMCLQFFCLQDSDKWAMYYQIMWAYEPKLHTCIYLQFMCITFLWMQPISIITQYKLNQYLFLVSIQQVQYVLLVSIFLWFSYSYSFLAYYLLSFVAHLVLFTIPSSSKGIPVVGLSSNGQ